MTTFKSFHKFIQPPLNAQAVEFTSDDILTMTGGISNYTDTQKLVCSFWFNLGNWRDEPDQTYWTVLGGGGTPSADENNQIVFVNFETVPQLPKDLYFAFFNEGLATISFAPLEDVREGWNHLVFGLEFVDGFEGPSPAMYLNGTVQSAGGATQLGGNMVWNASDLRIGRDHINTRTLRGDIAEFWLDDALLSIPLFESFYDTPLNPERLVPKNLGVDGSGPTGSAPLIYLSGNASVWNAGTNKGTSGDFDTVTGAVTDSVNEPIEVPLNVAVMTTTDLIQTSSISVYGGSFKVDWGSGTFTNYTAGSPAVVSQVPTGQIRVRENSIAPITRITFDTNTFTDIDIQHGANLTSFNNMCVGKTNLTTFNASNTYNVTDFGAAWNGCTGLTSFPLIDTSAATDFFTAWGGCTGLTTMPLIDTSLVTGFNGTWNGCSGLTSMPAIDTGASVDMNLMFKNCTSLVCLSTLDTTAVTGGNAIQLFENTPLLTSPNASEQTQLTTVPPGLNYINGSPCP